VVDPQLPHSPLQREEPENAGILEQQRAGVALAQHVGARGPMFR